MNFRNVNYRDLVQLAPEQCEELRLTLRALSEADMERSFKKVSEYKDEKRLRAAFGLQEMERVMDEIWRALMPKRSVKSKHLPKQKSYFTNFIFGCCLNLEENWRKFFPQYWNAMRKREYYHPFLFEAGIPSTDLKFKKVFINAKWEDLTICRYVISTKTFNWKFICLGCSCGSCGNRSKTLQWQKFKR